MVHPVNRDRSSPSDATLIGSAWKTRASFNAGSPFTLCCPASAVCKTSTMLHRLLSKEFIPAHADQMQVDSTKDRNTPEDPGRGEPGHADEPTQPVDPARL